MKKLTEESKKDIINSALIFCNSGMPEEHLARLLADRTIALLECCDEYPDWFESEESK